MTTPPSSSLMGVSQFSGCSLCTMSPASTARRWASSGSTTGCDVCPRCPGTTNGMLGLPRTSGYQSLAPAQDLAPWLFATSRAQAKQGQRFVRGLELDLVAELHRELAVRAVEEELGVVHLALDHQPLALGDHGLEQP